MMEGRAQCDISTLLTSAQLAARARSHHRSSLAVTREDSMSGGEENRPREGRWRRVAAGLPIRAALVAVGVVWVLGCVWSFQEQSAFAAAKGFGFPHLLPLVIDGFAVSMAGVSWAASLDGRPAIPARMATLVAVTASSASNGAWAFQRSLHDPVTVGLAVAVPVAANLAFEVLLSELRRQVQRRRGLPAPIPVPFPRLVRLALSPVATVREWRAVVLDLTAVAATSPTLSATAPSPAPASAPAQSTPVLAIPPHPHPHPHPQPPASADPISTATADPTTAEPVHHAAPRLDPRARDLATQLKRHANAEEVTGAQVADLLGATFTSRTGQRLLKQARELLERDADRFRHDQATAKEKTAV
jgi:hypothetical protein